MRLLHIGLASPVMALEGDASCRMAAQRPARDRYGQHTLRVLHREGCLELEAVDNRESPRSRPLPPSVAGGGAAPEHYRYRRAGHPVAGIGLQLGFGAAGPFSERNGS